MPTWMSVNAAEILRAHIRITMSIALLAIAGAAGAATPLPGTDWDGDGVLNSADNCSTLANASQLDSNRDGYGNACDADLDNSGSVNFSDLSLFKQRFTTSNPDANLDGIGLITFADLAIFNSLFGKPPGPSGITTANRPPAISGSPATTVVAGSPYVFTPTASDPEGQALTFSVRGAPAWAGLTSTTGKLSGTPAPGDLGVVSGIVITASDGTNTASLPAFSLAVVQIASGTATVSWLPPLQHTDGSALTDLAGYRLRFGTSPATLNQSIEFRSPGLTRYMAQGLTPGTWYFGLVAFDSVGTTSALSTVVSKRVT